MNTETTSAYKRDLHPKQFIAIVFLGCVASALLSWLSVPGWVSLIVAGGIMLWLATKRWQIARENNKDYQSLEAFAEDIYLLGYLLTLAALLGLAPRLMSNENNLFQIAGLKLVTTVFGLALMMVFRQTARRWAEAKKDEELDEYDQRARRFQEAVGCVNDSTAKLVTKLDEVVHWFDPTLVEPMAKWSNQASAAFTVATTNLEAVPGAVRASLEQLSAMGDGLGQVKAAAGELAGVLTAGTAKAANVLAAELENAKQAASGLGVAINALTSAGETARGGIEKLGEQSTKQASELGALGEGFRRTALELGKVERALKKLMEVDTKDVNAPMNRLAEVLEFSCKTAATAGEQMNALARALDKSVATTTTSSACMEALKEKVESATTAGKTLADRVGADLGKPLEGHQQALHGVRDQLAVASDRIASVAQQMEQANAKEHGRNGFEAKLLAELSGLQRQMGETNAQLKTLVARIDGAAGSDHKPGWLSRTISRWAVSRSSRG